MLLRALRKAQRKCAARDQLQPLFLYTFSWPRLVHRPMQLRLRIERGFSCFRGFGARVELDLNGLGSNMWHPVSTTRTHFAAQGRLVQ